MTAPPPCLVACFRPLAWLRAPRPAGGLDALPAQAIAQRLSAEVWGQDEAARALALMLWHHARGQRRTVVIAGPSGSGKTAMARAMEGLWPDVAWVDGASVTKDGWSGANKLSHMFSGMSRREAERAIVVIDEADKLFEPKHTAQGDNVSDSVQAELLKYLDGGLVTVELGKDTRQLSCEHVSFVLLGSFEWLLSRRARHDRASRGMGFGSALAGPGAEDGRRITKADLVRYDGVRREVAGRVMSVAMVRPLGVDDYLAILADHGGGPVARLEREYGVLVSLDGSQARRIAERAAASGLGVRSVIAQLEDALDERVWEEGLRERVPTGRSEAI